MRPTFDQLDERAAWYYEAIAVIHWRELLELDEQHDGVHHAERGITDS